MQFRSEGDSLAQSFAAEASMTSSYMLSSRASRRRQCCEAQQELEKFKDQIERRYTASISNKLYLFPFSLDAFTQLHDQQQLAYLKDKTQICLYEKEQIISQPNEQRDTLNPVLQLIHSQQQKIAATVTMIHETLNNKKRPMERKHYTKEY